MTALTSATVSSGFLDDPKNQPGHLCFQFQSFLLAGDVKNPLKCSRRSRASDTCFAFLHESWLISFYSGQSLALKSNKILIYTQITPSLRHVGFAEAACRGGIWCYLKYYSLSASSSHTRSHFIQKGKTMRLDLHVCNVTDPAAAAELVRTCEKLSTRAALSGGSHYGARDYASNDYVLGLSKQYPD